MPHVVLRYWNNFLQQTIFLCKHCLIVYTCTKAETGTGLGSAFPSVPVRIWLIFAAQSPHCLLNADWCWTAHFSNSKADLVADLSNRQICYQVHWYVKVLPKLGKLEQSNSYNLHWAMIFPQNNMPWSVISGCFSCPCLCWNPQGKQQVVAMLASYSQRAPPQKPSQLGRDYFFCSTRGWKRTDYFHLIYSNFYCKYIHSRAPAHNTIQMGRALFRFLSSLK